MVDGYKTGFVEMDDVPKSIRHAFYISLGEVFNQLLTVNHKSVRALSYYLILFLLSFFNSFNIDYGGRLILMMSHFRICIN